MAVNPEQPLSVMQMPGGAQVTNMTLPSESLCHYITDDQLERIGQMNDNLPMQICLSALGLLGGSITPAFDGLRRLGDAAKPLTSTDMVSIALACVAFGMCIVTAIQWYQKSKARSPIIQEIRERPRIAVRLVHENPA